MGRREPEGCEGELSVDSRSLLRRRAALVSGLERGWLEGIAKGPDLEFLGWGREAEDGRGQG